MFHISANRPNLLVGPQIRFSWKIGFQVFQVAITWGEFRICRTSMMLWKNQKLAALNEQFSAGKIVIQIQHDLSMVLDECS